MLNRALRLVLLTSVAVADYGLERFPDPGIDTAGNFARNSGTGAFDATGGALNFTAAVANLIALTSTPGNALQTLLAPSTDYTVVMVVTNFIAMTAGTVSLKNGTGVPLGFTADGTYTFTVTSGVSGTAGNAFRLNSVSGSLSITSVSVKLKP